MKRIKKIRKIHAIVSSTLFFSYIFLSLLYSPAFLFSDVKSKFSALADNTITIAASVLAPPVKPIVSLLGACDTGIFKITLSWPRDKNSVYFDITRNGLPLITGLSSQTYQDSNTTINSKYTYVVTAHGTMGPGFENSDPITIASSPVCRNISQPPTITLINLDPNKPLFSGTTNIPNSIINLEVHSNEIIYAQVLANANGYWSWNPPVNISNGSHVLYMTAQDPHDPSQIISGQLSFVTSPSSKKSLQNFTLPPATSSPPSLQENLAEIPLVYSLSFDQDSFRQDKKIESIVSIEKIEQKYENSQAVLTYEIYDSKEELIFTEKDKVVLSTGENIGKALSSLGYTKEGDYMLKTSLEFDSFIIEQEYSFHMNPYSFLSIGKNIVSSYPNFLSSVGTISIILTAFLLIWLLLIFREYWLHKNSTRHFAEKTFSKS